MQVVQKEFIDDSKDAKNKQSGASFFSRTQRIPSTMDFLEIESEMRTVADQLRARKNKKLVDATQKMQQKKVEEGTPHRNKHELKAEKIALLEHDKKLTEEIEELKASIKNLEFILQGSSKKQVGITDETIDLNKLLEDFIIGSDFNNLRDEHDKKSKMNKQVYTQSALKSNLEELQSNHEHYLKLKNEIEDEIKALKVKLDKVVNDITNLGKEIDKINEKIANSKATLKQNKAEVAQCEALIKEQRELKEKSNKTYENDASKICKNHEDTYKQNMAEYEAGINSADAKYTLDVDNAKWYRDENIERKKEEISRLRERIRQAREGMHIEIIQRFHCHNPNRWHIYAPQTHCANTINHCENEINTKYNDIDWIKNKCKEDIDGYGVLRNETVSNLRSNIDDLKKNKDPSLKKLLDDAQSAHEKLKIEIDKKIKKAESNLQKALNTVAETENIIRLAELSLESSKNKLKQNETEKKLIQDALSNKSQILLKINEKIAASLEKINLLNKDVGILQSNGVIGTDNDGDFLDLDENLCSQTFEEISAKRKRLGAAEHELYSLKIVIKKLVCPQDDSSEIPLIAAVLKGHEEMVTELLRLGVDPQLKDQYGWTALHCAVAKLHPMNRAIYEKIIRELVANGANLTETTPEGLSVQDLAVVEDIDNILTQHSNKL